MTRTSIGMALIGTALTLAACGNSSSSGRTQLQPTNGIPYSSGQTANLANLAAQSAINTKAGTAAYDSAAFSGEFQNLTLTVNDENSITFSFDGSDVTLTRTGGIGTFSGAIGDTNLTAITATDNSIFSGQVSQTRGGTATQDSETFFVTGFETNPTAIGTGAATYIGSAEMIARNRSGAPIEAAVGNTTLLNGTMEMEVNFSTKQIVDGNFTGNDFAGNQLKLDLAPISFAGQNNFATTASKDGSSASALTFGTINVNGGFYGNAAQQVGGTMYGQVNGGMPSGNPTNAAGKFVGAR